VNLDNSCYFKELFVWATPLKPELKGLVIWQKLCYGAGRGECRIGFFNGVALNRVGKTPCAFFILRANHDSTRSEIEAMNEAGEWIVKFFQPWLSYLHPKKYSHPRPAAPGDGCEADRRYGFFRKTALRGSPLPETCMLAHCSIVPNNVAPHSISALGSRTRQKPPRKPEKCDIFATF
jgi:hypothetical protein